MHFFGIVSLLIPVSQFLLVNFPIRVRTIRLSFKSKYKKPSISRTLIYSRLDRSSQLLPEPAAPSSDAARAGERGEERGGKEEEEEQEEQGEGAEEGQGKEER